MWDFLVNTSKYPELAAAAIPGALTLCQSPGLVSGLRHCLPFSQHSHEDRTPGQRSAPTPPSVPLSPPFPARLLPPALALCVFALKMSGFSVNFRGESTWRGEVGDTPWDH